MVEISMEFTKSPELFKNLDRIHMEISEMSKCSPWQ